MTRPLRLAAAIAALLCAAVLPAMARERAPFPDTAFDSGVQSAETLGRGNTIASNRGTPASGSENPAGLQLSDIGGSLYATTLVNTRTVLPHDVADGSDPLNGKVIQYLSVGADKGVLFYEPISRLHQTQVVDATAGTSRDVDLNANALGFAGAQKWKDGSFGLSIAYLFSSLNVIDRNNGAITDVTHDTQDGLRLNLGVRYPTGPAMWGAVIQNAPGLLWGSAYKRSELPVRIRVGNTYRLAKGVLFSLDAERRFYHEGGHGDNYVYVGNETYVSEHVVARVGAFGTSLNSADTRTITAGATIIARDNTQISYAYEQYQLDGEKVKRSIVSVSLPFEASNIDDGSSKYK